MKLILSFLFALSILTACSYKQSELDAFDSQIKRYNAKYQLKLEPTGSGGPEFTYPDENLPANKSNNYPAGTVAMANSGPNTNGSRTKLQRSEMKLTSPNLVNGNAVWRVSLLEHLTEIAKLLSKSSTTYR